MSTIRDALAETARERGDHLAISFGGATLPYAELNRRTGAAAARLRAWGIGEGEVVAVRASACVEWVALAHAAPRIGAVLLPLNTRWTEAEMRELLERARAKILLIDGEPPPGIAARVASISGIDAPHPAPVVDAVARSIDHPQTLIFTAGTTGRTKGAVLTAGNHDAASAIAVTALEMTPGDRWLACLPLFHIGGLNILYRAARAGAEVMLQASFDPGEANRAIDDGATLASFVERMLRLTLERRAGRPMPDSLRAIVVGGGPVAADLVDACPQVRASYGLTEACSMATLVPRDASHQERRTAGRALPGIEIRIAGEDGAAVPAGSEGRIELRGPTVMHGYLGDPEASRAALRDRWLVTNDIGAIDAGGFLRVLGRRTDLILSGGENIYPAEIEEAIRSHPAVADAAVIGIADPEWGERPLALVVPRTPPPSVCELQTHLAPKLARYKIPAIRFVNAIPRLASGKPDRARIRALHAGREVDP